MNRIVNLAKTNNVDKSNNNHNVNDNQKSCYLPTLGYVSMKSNNNV
jgi:hypothetical protein